MGRLLMLLLGLMGGGIPAWYAYGGKGKGGGDSMSSGSMSSADFSSASGAAGVPELDGGMLFLALALTLAIVAIVREKYAQQS